MASNRELILGTVKENVSLSAFDAATGEIVAMVPVGVKDIAKPHEIAITRDGATAFVSLYGDRDYGPNKPDNRLARLNPLVVVGIDFLVGTRERRDQLRVGQNAFRVVVVSGASPIASYTANMAERTGAMFTPPG